MLVGSNVEKIEKFLALEPNGDSGAKTVREYLTRLLVTLWLEGESFSGKRPFGNSDWQWDDIGDPAVREGLVTGKIDDRHGEVEEIAWPELDRLVEAAIYYVMEAKE